MQGQTHKRYAGSKEAKTRNLFPAFSVFSRYLATWGTLESAVYHELISREVPSSTRGSCLSSGSISGNFPKPVNIISRSHKKGPYSLLLPILSSVVNTLILFKHNHSHCIRTSGMANCPVRESLRSFGENSWIFGNRLILSYEPGNSPNNISCGNNDFSYSISETNEPYISSQSISTYFPLIHDAGDAHAVWKVGDAYLKISIPASPYSTREHVTLNSLHKKELCLGLRIPKVLYHGEWDGRYYLIVTGMPGQTLHQAWPQMDESKRQECIGRVSQFCGDLATQRADFIGGVDGRHLPEDFLTSENDTTDDRFSHGKLLQNCRSLGMDCSTFTLYHCDLGPGNIVFDFENDSIAVIDFECVGYVPKDWIRTKFRLSSGMDLEAYDGEASTEWRSRMQIRLGEEGFQEVAQEWMDWQVAVSN